VQCGTKICEYRLIKILGIRINLIAMDACDTAAIILAALPEMQFLTMFSA